MKIAIDISPLSSGHGIRGVGFYLKNLLSAFKKYYPENEYIEFVKTIPSHVDVIHYPYFDPFSLNPPLIGKKNTIVTVHDLTPLILPALFPVGIKGRINWQIQKKLLRNVSRIITDSNSSKQDVEKLVKKDQAYVDSIYLAPAEHFRVIKDIKTLLKVSKKYYLPKKFLLYVGDVTPNKNLPNLVNASLQTPLPLIMVGKALKDEAIDLSHPWTKDIKEVRSLAATHKEKITILGFVPDEDLVALYNLATAFVMPSLYEGFGLPILEANACGCPVVASDRGSLIEIGSDSTYVVNPDSLQDIARGLCDVIDSKNLQEKLRNNGLRFVKAFSWKKTAQETLSAYEKVLQT